MSTTQGTQEYRNWSGSLRFTPRRIERVSEEDAVVALVKATHARGGTLRVVGAGHSATRILETDDTLVSLEEISGVIDHDPARRRATVGAGSTLREIAKELLDEGLALPNFGDVATQRVAGALGTGTHGTGLRYPILSHMLVGGRMVTGTGEVVEFSEDEPELLCAARVALGTLGVFTHLRLQLSPVYMLQRREWCTTVGPCLEHLEELVRTNQHADFYWYPRSDQVKLRLLNAPGGGTMDLPYAALVEDRTSWGDEVIPKHSDLPFRFDEIEYAMPYDAGVPCFLEIRERLKRKWRADVAWRVLYRVVAADDAYLSPAHGRLTAYISVHHNAGLPYHDFFDDIEPIMRAHDGRPHWAKKHSLRAAELRPLYPRWDSFLEQRARLDPDGVFLSPYLRELLGVEDR